MRILVNAAALGALSALAALGSPTFAAEPYPFVGRWGGGPTDCTSPFVLTATTYAPPGEKAARIKSIKKASRGYEIALVDGYRFTVSRITRGSLNWYSLASGDGFTLKRCAG